VWLRAAVWVVVCWVVVFWKIADPALMDPDEAHYAQLTREMWRAGNWMVPLLDGLPYIDKPAFFHWLQGLAIALLGETEAAMRLPSALAAVALFWLTRWTGTQLFDAKVGERAWLMLATLPMTFLLAGLGVFDMVFTLFLFGSVSVALVSMLRHRPRLQYLAYVMLSLAVMTKGPVALVLAALIFLVSLACGREARAAILSLHWRTGTLLALVLSLPWFVWMYTVLGYDFVHQYALAGNLYYVTQPHSFSARGVNHTLYLSTLLAGFFPWSLLMLGGGVDAFRRLRSAEKPRLEEMLLWAWVAVVFLFFSLARFKVDRYLYPAAPACCLLAARAWLSLDVTRVGAATVRQNVGARAAVTALAIALLVVGSVGLATLFDLGLELPRAAAIVPIAFAAGGLLVGYTLFKRRSVSAALFVTVSTVLLVIYSGVVAFGVPVLERTRPTAELSAELRPLLGETDRVGLYRVDKWRFSLRYYIGRPLRRLENADEVRAFFNEPGTQYVLMQMDDYERLRAEGIDLQCVSERPAVVGTTGRGLRKQRWGTLLVATSPDRGAEPIASLTGVP
jgi:4-amino-4-deoxy-L-arabinose transferase-like glycosyltransferase